MLEPIYTTNLLDYFNEYTQDLDPLKISNLKTALYRYYGAGLSGHKTKKVRLDQRGLNKAERYLKEVIVDENFSIESHRNSC
jgi:hypothetical protein